MLLATLLCYVGFTALCLSMPRHYAELLQRRPAPHHGRTLKTLGWLLLIVSLWSALDAEQWGITLAQWCAALMFSALLLVFLLPYRPRLALTLAATGLVLSPVLALNQLLV